MVIYVSFDWNSRGEISIKNYFLNILSLAIAVVDFYYNICISIKKEFIPTNRLLKHGGLVYGTSRSNV